MRVRGRFMAIVAMSLLLISGCTGSGPSPRERAAPMTVAVPDCAHPPCGGGPGSIRWSRALPTGAWTIYTDGDYRTTQTPQPTRGSENEVMPAILAAGTASTIVVSLADHVLAFDARTGAIRWSLPVTRLPAHSVITSVNVVDGVVSLEVTQELSTATWRYHAVLLDLTTGRMVADTAGYHAGAVLATPTRVVVENNGVLQGVDRSTGRIVWTRTLGQNPSTLLIDFDGRLIESLPPKPGQARALLVLDPRDGKTVDTMTAPHDVYTLLSRGKVLYFAAPGSAYAYDTGTRTTLWRVTLPAHDNVIVEIDPNDGAAYVAGSLPKAPHTSTVIRVELSGRRTAQHLPACELRAATTVECSTSPSPTSRARGGPAGAPTTWQSPPIPYLSKLSVFGFTPGGSTQPGPDYTVGVSCPTSQISPRPGSPTTASSAGGLPRAPAPPVCNKPYLVVINRT